LWVQPKYEKDEVRHAKLKLTTERKKQGEKAIDVYTDIKQRLHCVYNEQHTS
jgi:hypothetical protein